MTELNPNHNGQLKSVVERIQNIEQEEAKLRADKKDVYAEEKSSGFDVPRLKKVVSLLRKSADERAEDAAIVGLYMNAIGA